MARSTRIFTGIGMLPDLPPVVPSEGRLTDTQVAYLTDSIRNLIRAVNGRLTFGDGSNSSQSGNVDGQMKEVTFTNANTDYEVPHGLERVPIGIITLDVNADGAVVRGGSRGSWSPTRLFVRCNVAGTTALFVVV
jgi:hypothetical protein